MTSRIVYVGSIPYDQTEEQILDIFKSVGPVANFRLVFDKDTGRPKGFGFVEYHDEETAASAVRNLNNYEIGSRKLRVDFSHESTTFIPGPGGGRGDSVPPDSGFGQSGPVLPTGPANLGTARGVSGGSVPSSPGRNLVSLPQGTPLAPGASSSETITKVLAEFSDDKRKGLGDDFKQFVSKNPLLAEQLFRDCPQLSYAAVQTFLALGELDSQTVAQLVEGDSQTEGEPPQSGAQPQTQSDSIAPEQAALIQQVMQLSDDQIEALPDDQRDAIRILKQRVASGEIQV